MTDGNVRNQLPSTAENGKTKILVRAALLLATAAAAQGLRLILPLPGLFTMFFIGSIVNACLVLTAYLTRVRLAAVSSLLLPFIAYLQGQLVFWPLILIVAAGNFALCLTASRLKGIRLLLVGPVLKMILLWAGSGLIFSLLHFADPFAKMMQTMLSWPQWITAVLGIILAEIVTRLLRKRSVKTQADFLQ